jgi:hypothetical protein
VFDALRGVQRRDSCMVLGLLLQGDDTLWLTECDVITVTGARVYTGHISVPGYQLAARRSVLIRGITETRSKLESSQKT